MLPCFVLYQMTVSGLAKKKKGLGQDNRNRGKERNVQKVLAVHDELLFVCRLIT